GADLVLVRDGREEELGVVDDVLELLLDRIRIERGRPPAERLGGEHRPVELRPVVADDSDLVAADEAQRREPQRDGARLREVIAPCGRLPDAVVLLTDGDAVGDALGVRAGKLRKRVLRARRCVRRQVSTPQNQPIGSYSDTSGGRESGVKFSQAPVTCQANRDVITVIYAAVQQAVYFRPRDARVDARPWQVLEPRSRCPESCIL